PAAHVPEQPRLLLGQPLGAPAEAIEELSVLMEVPTGLGIPPAARDPIRSARRAVLEASAGGGRKIRGGHRPILPRRLCPGRGASLECYAVSCAFARPRPRDATTRKQQSSPKHPSTSTRAACAGVPVRTTSLSASELRTSMTIATQT